MLGFFIARYRGIFFSMLTLAISMVVYAIATKVRMFGGSDGLNISLMSFAAYHPRGPDFQTTYFLFSVWTCALFGIAAHMLQRSRLGKIIDVIDENEIGSNTSAARCVTRSTSPTRWPAFWRGLAAP